jgi:uncharacterized repeat protein (TIGR02543 family)
MERFKKLWAAIGVSLLTFIFFASCSDDGGSSENPAPQPTRWTVTFDLAGGIRTGGGELTQIVDNGQNAILPIVSRAGHTLSGWNGSHTNITSNRTITAQWQSTGGGDNPQPTNITITYNGNGTGVTGTTVAQTVPANSSFQTRANGFQRTGYTFVNWNTQATGDGQTFTAGQNASFPSNTTLFAQWESTGGGGGDPQESGSNNLADGTYGWTAARDDLGSTSSVTANPNNVSFSITTLPENDPVWPWAQITSVPNYNWSNFGSITITYTSNVGFRVVLFDPTLPDGTSFRRDLPAATSSSTVTINASDFTQPSWVTSGTTLNRATITGVIVSGLPGTSLTGSITRFQLNAGGGGNPEPQRWTVTFDPAGGTRTSGGELIQSVINGQNATLPILATRAGWTFTGWSGSHTNVTSNRTITAQWQQTGGGDPQPQRWTVTFDPAGGTRTGGGELTQIVNNGQNATLPTLATRAGWTFTGWSGSHTNVTSNRTITAQWNQNPPQPERITITYVRNGGTGGTFPPAHTNGTLVAGTPITVWNGAGMTRANFAFNGWMGSDGNTYTGGQTNVVFHSNVTLTAQWRPLSARAVFDGNGHTGGNPPAPITRNEGQSLTLPQQGNMVRTGHFFRGWALSATAQTPVTNTATVNWTGDRTFYAVWTRLISITVNNAINPAGFANSVVIDRVAIGQDRITPQNVSNIARFPRFLDVTFPTGPLARGQTTSEFFATGGVGAGNVRLDQLPATSTNIVVHVWVTINGRDREIWERVMRKSDFPNERNTNIQVTENQTVWRDVAIID